MMSSIITLVWERSGELKIISWRLLKMAIVFMLYVIYYHLDSKIQENIILVYLTLQSCIFSVWHQSREAPREFKCSGFLICWKLFILKEMICM